MPHREDGGRVSQTPEVAGSLQDAEGDPGSAHPLAKARCAQPRPALERRQREERGLHRFRGEQLVRRHVGDGDRVRADGEVPRRSGKVGVEVDGRYLAQGPEVDVSGQPAAIEDDAVRLERRDDVVGAPGGPAEFGFVHRPSPRLGSGVDAVKLDRVVLVDCMREEDHVLHGGYFTTIPPRCAICDGENRATRKRHGGDSPRRFARRFARRIANALLPPHLYKSGGRSEAEVII